MSQNTSKKPSVSKSKRNRSSSKRSHSGKKRVFLTGVTGFISPAVAEHLHSLGYHISGLVRKSARSSPALDRLKSKIEIYDGNLQDASCLGNILREARPDIILHFGAITPVSYSFDHPQEVTMTNLIGTINLVEAARRWCPNLELFAMSSSMEVYGVQEPKPFHEYINVFPNCPYAVTKEACERYLRYLWQSYKMPVVAVRQTNCYGRLDNDYFVVEAFITQMLTNKKEVNFGRKEPVRNFIHIDDMCRFYEAVINHHGEHCYGEVYNTGPSNGITIESLSDIIREVIGYKGKVNWNTRELRPGEIFYLNSKNDKATRDFGGWQPEVKLRDGIKRAVNHWKKKVCLKK